MTRLGRVGESSLEPSPAPGCGVGQVRPLWEGRGVLPMVSCSPGVTSLGSAEPQVRLLSPFTVTSLCRPLHCADLCLLPHRQVPGPPPPPHPHRADLPTPGLCELPPGEGDSRRFPGVAELGPAAGAPGFRRPPGWRLRDPGPAAFLSRPQFHALGDSPLACPVHTVL